MTKLYNLGQPNFIDRLRTNKRAGMLAIAFVPSL